MPTASTAPHDLQTLAGGDLLRLFLVAADILQEQRRPHPESGRQRDQSLQARGHMAGFESAQHSGADSGGRRDVGQCQSLALSHPPCDRAELPADIGRRAGAAAGRNGS